MMLAAHKHPVPSGVLSAFISLAVGACCHANDAGQPYICWYENVLGTSLQLHVVASSSEVARQAEAAALEEIDRLEAILSTYTERSELAARLRKPGVAQEVSDELREVLRFYDHWRAASGGALNPAVEVITRVWRRATDQGRLPTEAELGQAVQAAAAPAWKIHEDGSVSFGGGVAVSVNAIAKGYIVDRAGQAALRCNAGVRGILLDIGGDMRVFGEMTEKVGIADPASPAENGAVLCTIELRDQAIATSGGYERGFKIGGAWYSHLIDPRSGLPVERVRSATAIAPTAAEADALATILSVLPPEESLALVERLPGSECLLVFHDGSRRASPGWRALPCETGSGSAAGSAGDRLTETQPLVRESSQAARMLLTSQVGAASAGAEGIEAAEEPEAPAYWGQQFEAVVDFQIAPARSRRYQRPYVAVWVEDANGTPVRTLALWYGHPRWLPDLRRWYAQHWRDPRLLRAVSRASRSPGRYQILWDGIGNDGRYVPSGKYTVLIEAAREHGTYQLMRKEVELRGQPFTVELGGNFEISRAALEYRKREPPAER